MDKWDKDESKSNKKESKIEKAILSLDAKVARVMPKPIMKLFKSYAMWRYEHGIHVSFKMWAIIMVSVFSFATFLTTPLFGHIIVYEYVNFDKSKTLGLDQVIEIILLIILFIFNAVSTRGEGGEKDKPKPDDTTDDVRELYPKSDS